MVALAHDGAFMTGMRMKEDMEKMVAVGLVWGATNALIRRGALAWDKRSSTTESSPPLQIQSNLRRKILAALRDWINLLLFWQHSVPFLINLSASATFFALLSHAPISIAVPVTNATTFAATAAFGILLGEETQIGPALLGTTFIVFGIWLCVGH
ncbi:hypothetical protein EUTSA_v10014912mg [Eutrema salsugineum]|uniref:Transmembrane protein 234 homolog n=1 Tax=Eutrema salsugineum TaxID=72664 RepID=V4KVF9_EUTSA|nr:transmembrane protein 234 homolog [Eutrema salsugineum]ESQ41970.1 hypothetical protein EUTSA_v10014912mg [Eutrema salsugineum]